jgi:hypothetical protein
VKADAILSRLLALRRLGEQRALEALAAREGDCRRAEQAVEQAADDAARNLAATSAYERQRIKSVAGQPVPERVLRRFREEVDVRMNEQQRLRAVGETAEQALTERRTALHDAQAAFRSRQRAAAKLDHLARLRSAGTALREAAQAEAADEEPSRGASRLPPSDGN